ncbi:MAG TPA: hypothetical protein V6D18_15995 [Thermosynechococcaceae cyanobacterium]
MTRLLFDQFSKNLLGGLLPDGGAVQQGYTLSSEVKEVDILFQPDPDKISSLQGLGLLGRMVEQFCLIEPYRNPVSTVEVQVCLGRAIEVGLHQRREAKQNQIPAKQVVLPHLWILSPTVSEAVLEGFGARQTQQWGKGVYVLPESLRTAIVVIHQLPVTLDTLVLRLLGRGAVQNQAIAELLALSTAESFRKVCLYHLAKLQLTMKTRQKLSKDDRELIDTLQPAYEEWERETIEKGRQEGIEQDFNSCWRELCLCC